MAAVVEKSMQELRLDKVDAAVEPKVTELHVYGTTAADNAEAVKAVAQPGTPVAAEKASATDGTAEKLKKQRRRRGKKPAAAADKVTNENALLADSMQSAADAEDGKPSAAPVDVAAILKARAAAKKGGRKGKPASAAAQAALANAKARPQKKSGAKGGRSEGGPRAAKTGKSQNDKCLP